MAMHTLRLLTKSSQAGLTQNLCPEHLLRALAPRLASHPSDILQSGNRHGRHCSTGFNGRFGSSRQFSSIPSKSFRQDLISADNIVRSIHPDQNIPTNEPFHSIIFQKCDEFKSDLAIEEFLTGKALTYSQVKELSVKVAKSLYNQGLRKGDVILVYSTNCADFTVLMLACSFLGVWFSTANPALTAEELARHIEHCDAQAIFTVPFLVDNIKKALDHPDYTHKLKKFFVFGESEGYQPFQNLTEVADHSYLPDININPVEDVFALPYSSGTTGFPKGVMLTHYNCLADILQTRPGLQAKRGDNGLGLLPLYHIYGLIVIQFINMYVGISVHLLPKFEPETFLQCLQDKKINLAPLVPPLLVFLAKHPLASKYDLSSLEHVVCGAAPLGAAITEEFREKYPQVKTLNQGYGMTELSPVTHLDVFSKPGSVGNLVANTLAKIVDIESGQTLGVGQSGEVAVKGPQVMKGYYKNQEATDDMIKDGWLYTGDIGCFDKDGLFYIQDRLKELIKYKGNQVAPAELEALLLSHPEVQDVAVLGIPDDRAGELPKAFVVKKPNSAIKEEEICKFVEENVSPTKQLRGGVQFIEEVPKNPSGKILRRILKQKYVV